MLKQCFFCQATSIKPPFKNWIEEKHYLGALKTEADYQKNYQGSVFYCSWLCMEKQLDKEEKEAWAKGDCASCQQPLVVLNEQCSDQKHSVEAHCFPLGGQKKKGGQHA